MEGASQAKKVAFKEEEVSSHIQNPHPPLSLGVRPLKQAHPVSSTPSKHTQHQCHGDLLPHFIGCTYIYIYIDPAVHATIIHTCPVTP